MLWTLTIAAPPMPLNRHTTPRQYPILSLHGDDGLPREAMMRFVRAAGMLGVMTLAGPAYAIGSCEDNPLHFETPVSFSATEKRLAISANQAWCEEQETSGQEVRGNVRFVEIRDLTNTVVERLSSERKAQAKRLKEKFSEINLVSAAQLTSTLKTRGFVALSAKAVSPAGGCTARPKWTKSKEDVNGFPAGNVNVEIVAGKKVIAAAELGLAARQRRGEVALRASFLPDDKSVVIWARVPQCNGPPPGYFDKDFEGDCYSDDEVAIKQLTLTAFPALATCFVADPPPR